MPQTLVEMAAEDNAARDAAAASSSAALSPPAESDASDASPPAPDAGNDTPDPKTDDAAADATADAAGGADDQDEPTVRSWAKDVLGGDRDWLDKYKDDEAFIRGIDELQKKLGERNDAGRIVEYMQQQGITPADLQRLVADKSKGPQPAAASTGPEWDPKWISVGADGSWTPTASAPADIEAKIRSHRAKLNEAMADPAKLAEFLRPYLSQDLKAATETTKAEVERRLAQESDQRASQDLADKHAATLFVDGKPRPLATVSPDGLTPFGSRVAELASDQDLWSPTLPWHKRLERAMKFAADEQKPSPQTKAVPPVAKRQSVPAAGKKQEISDEEAYKKANGDLAAFIELIDGAK